MIKQIIKFENFANKVITGSSWHLLPGKNDGSKPVKNTLTNLENKIIDKRQLVISKTKQKLDAIKQKALEKKQFALEKKKLVQKK